MRSLSAVVEAGHSTAASKDFSDLTDLIKMSFIQDDDPLELAVQEFLMDSFPPEESQEGQEFLHSCLARLDLHLQSGYHPTLSHLDRIADPAFKAQHIQPYLATLLKSSTSHISYSKEGPNSACSHVSLSKFLDKFKQKDPTNIPNPISLKMLQMLVQVGYDINELLLAAIYCEQTETVALLLKEGADPNFQISEQLAKSIAVGCEGFYYGEGYLLSHLVGSTALHLIFMSDNFTEPNCESLCFDQVNVVNLVADLLEAGADVKATNDRGKTAVQQFDIALKGRRDKQWGVPSAICIKKIKTMLSSRKRNRK